MVLRVFISGGMGGVRNGDKKSPQLVDEFRFLVKLFGGQ